MKKTILTLIAFLSFSICFISVVTPSEAGEEFEKRYTAWKQHISSLPYNGDISPYINNNVFKNIIKMNCSAVPLIIAKLKKGEDKEAIYLTAALEQILKIKRYESEWDPEGRKFVLKDKTLTIPEGLNPWVFWWQADKYKTRERFNKSYDRWQKYSKSKGYSDNGQAMELMMSEGVPIIPGLMVLLEKGDESVIPVISYLVNFEIRAVADKDSVLKWWAGNKQRWTKPLEIN